MVAVSSGCYSAGVGRVEEDVEFNRFFGFIFGSMGGTQVAPFGFMWFTSVACQLDAAGLSDVANSVSWSESCLKKKKKIRTNTARFDVDRLFFFRDHAFSSDGCVYSKQDMNLLHCKQPHLQFCSISTSPSLCYNCSRNAATIAKWK